MAAPQSKSSSSCSPLLNRPTNPRNSEIGNPMRRSFSGNPFAKPSVIQDQKPGFNPNALSDHFQRNSTGRESIVVSSRDYEDKENGKDQKSKLGSVRSPASSHGTKNFMSPTISAASKVNASPRKRILTERNESVRTSVSISNGNGPLKEQSLEWENDLKKKKGVSFNPTVTYMEQKEEEAWSADEVLDSVVSSNHVLDDFDSFSKRVAAENDIVNLDPSFKISPRTSTSLPSPALAPLDADPLMPPYDLNTNYVSPRPQFLHYKPNPLVELYLKQRNGKQLEEIFSSESSSDTGITEQKTVSEESSLDSHKESEDAASSDIMTEEEEEEEASELPVSEPNPITTFEGPTEARKMAKRHFLTRPKLTALLFVLALAGFWASVSNSPIMDPSVLSHVNFPNLYVPPNILEFTRENWEGLAQKSRQWLYDSLSYAHNLVISFREWHHPSCLQFANLTLLLEENSVSNYLLVDHSTFVAELMNERKGYHVKSFEKEADQPVELFQNEDEVEVDDFVDEAGHNNEDGEKFEQSPEDEEVEGDIDEVVEEGHNIEAEESYEVVDGEGAAEYKEAIVVLDRLEALEVAIAPNSEEESVAIQSDKPTRHGKLPTDEAAEHNNVAMEVTLERIDIAENITAQPVSTDVAEQSVAIVNAKTEPEPVETESTMTAFNPKSFESEATAPMEQQIPGSVGILSRQAVIGISFLTVLSVIAVVTFIYMKNGGKSRGYDAANTANQVFKTKKVDHSPLPATTRNTFQESSFSRHWQEEVETIGESCPSEMSSFLNSSSCGKQERRATSEAQSQETRKPRSNTRRESMASSDCSTWSASYGSFTTYEKVPIKLGKSEEEFLTPVRRSSRIKKQVTSP